MNNINENNSKTVAFNTLGCRLNFSETGSISQGFVDRGYSIKPFDEKADIYFINTCTVTDDADSTCRNLIRKAHRTSPEAKIVVAGCYAQMEPEKIKNIQGVDLILGTSEKYNVFKYLEQEQENKIKIDHSNDFWGAATSLAEGHTRAFLKIQDGCNYICSYCIIPQARGRSKAISINEALKNANELVKNGFKEIVLTGVNIGEYESSCGEKLEHLVHEILGLDGLQRLRLSSVEPNTITPRLLDVLKSSDKFMPHFHIPLQSGDDNVLTQMRRRYNLDQYTDILNSVKEYFPHAGIGADIIVGHPGETQQQFENTFSYLKQGQITHFHVFPFSKRQNTLSAKMENQIPNHVKKQRVQTLRMLGQAKLNDFGIDFIGTRQHVLFERKDKQGFYTGYTPHFLKVKLKTDQDLSNQIHNVEITSCSESVLQAQLV